MKNIENQYKERYMDFIKLKDEYYKYRKNERNSLSAYIRTFLNEKYKGKDKNLKVRANGGRTGYTSGSRLKTKYNLSNWMWIDIHIDKLKILLSFQTFDHDPKNGNLHVLMDRIGLYVYSGKYSAIDAQKNMMITNIELPLKKEDKLELANLVYDITERSQEV